MKEDQRICPLCSKPVHGRSDKVFCSETCRRFSASQRRNDDEHLLRNIIGVIHKNRKILKSLCPTGRAKVDRSVLTSLGYDASIFTSLYITGNNHWYHICGDYAVMPLIENKVQRALIVTVITNLVPWDPWALVELRISKRQTEKSDDRID